MNDFFRRNIFGAQCGNNVLIAHLAAEGFKRLAFRLKRLHQRDPVAEPFADAFLDQFVHDGIGQLVAFDIKVVQDQLPLDQLFQAIIDHIAQLLLKHVRVAGIFPPQCLGRRHGEVVDFHVGDNGGVDHGLDAVNQFRAQRQAETRGRRQN